MRETTTGPAPRRAVATARHTGLSGAPEALMALQRSAGNAAVATAVQRLQAGAEPPRPLPANPAADPRFVALKGEVRAKAAKARSHPRPKAEAEKAKAAAVPPSNDKEAQAQAAQADVMAGAKPGGFDKAGFIAAVKAAIAAQAPKNLEEAEDFGSSGKAEAVKGQVAGRVSEGKQRSAQDIADKTSAAPDPSAAKDKTVVALAPHPSPALGSVNAASGMPTRAPAEQTDFSGGKQQTDQQMAEAEVSEEQLAHSNEPEFTGAVEAKKEGEAHSATAPGQVRESETATLATARQGAAGESKTGLLGMVGAKVAALTKSTSGKVTAKSKDETARAKVAAGVKGIFDRTKTEVGAILGALDKEVATRFDNGEKTIRGDFTRQHKTEMAEYKDKRYGGWDGAALWIADKVTSLPKEADEIFVRAKARYEERMSELIANIADFIGAQLTAAKDKIAAGRKEIKAFVDQQPKELRKVGAEAAEKFESQFDQLENDVDSKQDGLVQDLASKYVEARGAVDEEIVAAQEENKGLWDKAKDAIGGAIKTILKLKDMLLGVLARAAGAIGKIIKDPIGFLGNFVNAVKGGIMGFASRIEDHLVAGLKSWLLGALAEGGIQLPEKWDLKGVVQLILSILGLTWETIKGRIAQKIPPKVLDTVIKGFEVVQVLVSQGVGGLWKWVLEKVGDIKEMVMSQIQEMVATEILKAGITWLISLLNPASAFVKACKMIYDVVMFFVEKADQIKEFVDSVLDSVESIAGGGVGAVAGYIEKTLAKMLPVLIGFLASLLGLGGISGKIQKILATVQKPVMKVVDWVVGKAVAFGKKAWAGMKRLGGKLKAKGKALLGKAKKKLGIKEKTPEQIEKEKKARLDKGVAAGVRAVNRFAGKLVGDRLLRPVLAAIRLRYRMSLLEPVEQQGKWAVHGVVNPEAYAGSKAEVGGNLDDIIKQLASPSLPDLILALDYLSPETHAFVTYPKGMAHYANSSGRHAEWNFDADIRANLLKKIDGRRYKKGGAVPVTLRMNRTPCDDCSAVLESLRSATIADRQINLTVLSSSAYGGKRWETWLMQHPGDARVPKPILRSGLEKLASLKARGTKLGVWDIWSQISAGVIAGDSRLAGLDPELLHRNAEAARILEGTLKEVSVRLTLPAPHH
jgi:hypothetical protein